MKMVPKNLKIPILGMVTACGSRKSLFSEKFVYLCSRFLKASLYKIITIVKSLYFLLDGSSSLTMLKTICTRLLDQAVLRILLIFSFDFFNQYLIYEEPFNKKSRDFTIFIILYKAAFRNPEHSFKNDSYSTVSSKLKVLHQNQSSRTIVKIILSCQTDFYRNFFPGQE